MKLGRESRKTAYYVHLRNGCCLRLVSLLFRSLLVAYSGCLRRPFRVVELHMLDDNTVYCSLRDSHSVTAEPTAHSVVYKFLHRDYVQSLLCPIVTQLLGYRENAHFNVYGSVHRLYIPIYIQQDANVTQFIYIWKLPYVFWVVPPPIVRSAYNFIYSISYLSHRYCYLQIAVTV